MNKNISKIFKKEIPTLIVVFAVFLFSFFYAVFGTGEEREESDKIKIVTTTTMLCDMVKNIAGDKAEVTGLMGSGVDPHLYQAGAGDVTIMENSDVVIYNGLHLEGKMGDIFKDLNSMGKTVICASDGVDKSKLIETEASSAVYDPHIWFDVSVWKEAAVYVGKSLCTADPKNSEYYEENLRNYIKELESLESYIDDKLKELPKEKRILVTAHDAFGYFGKAYGFQVKGLQGISTDAQTGTKDISLMAKFIADNKIKAVFAENSLPKATINALYEAVKNKGFETNIGGQLYSDSLGDKENGGETYIKAFKSNVDTIVRELS